MEEADVHVGFEGVDVPEGRVRDTGDGASVTFNGSVAVGAALTLQGAGGNNPVGTFNGGVTAGTLSLLGDQNNWPQLNGSGTVTVTGLTTWTAGLMGGTGGRTVALGGLAIGGSAFKALGARTLENAGVGTWTGTGNIELSSGAVFANLAGAAFDVQTDRSFVNVGGATPAVTNAGTFRKSAGAGTAAINVPFHNAQRSAATTAVKWGPLSPIRVTHRARAQPMP